MTVGKTKKKKVIAAIIKKVDLYQGLKQLQWDYRNLQDSVQTNMQLPTMMTD